jgi:multiple sugar transport system substrate-binding protein
MFIMVTPTLTPTLQKSVVAGKYAFAPMPTIPYGMQQRPPGGVPASTIVSGDMLAIANYSNVKDLALKFINLITDEQHQIQYNKTFGDLPANVQAANSLASQDPQTAAFIQAEAGASPTPFTGVWGPLEVSLAGVSSKLANEVATSRYSPSHIKPLLDQANQQIQGQLH